MTEEYWTVAEVAQHLCVGADAARGQLSRWGIRGAVRYPADAVRTAHAQRPGRGARRDLERRTVIINDIQHVMTPGLHQGHPRCRIFPPSDGRWSGIDDPGFHCPLDERPEAEHERQIPPLRIGLFSSGETGHHRKWVATIPGDPQPYTWPGATWRLVDNILHVVAPDGTEYPVTYVTANHSSDELRWTEVELKL